MMTSLRDKILPLADDTVVLPGHGPATTIGRERAQQPVPAGTDRRARPRSLTFAGDSTVPISGFPEWLPPQRMIEQQFLDRIRTTFELYGFAPLETRAVEPLDTLLSKGETSKEVYLLRRLQEDPDAQRRRPARPALRPDRAVRPLRRGERRQAAVPVPPLPDPEGVARRAPAGGPLPRVPAGRHRRGQPGHPAVPLRHRDAAGDRGRVRRSLPIPPARILVNNRKVCEGFYRGLGLDRHRPGAAHRRQARQDRPGEGGRRCWSRPAGATEAQAAACLRAGRDLRRRTPPSSTRSASSGSATRCSTRAWTSWSGWSRRPASTRRAWSSPT